MSIYQNQLKAIADAIRAKDGTTDLIYANQFYQRILALPQGEEVENPGIVVVPTEQGYLDAIEQVIQLKEGSTDHIEPKDFASRILGLQKPSRPPKGYTTVEYIESNGTQYIDTGIKPITTTRIVMDVAPTVAGSSSEKFFISSHFFPSNSSYKYALRILWDNGGVKASMVRYSSAVSSTTLSSNTALRRMLLEMDVSKKTASVDGVSKTFSDTTISSGLSNILLLTYNKSSTYAVSAKTYSCQIYTGDDLIRDFVPCINPSGTAGLYDMVEKAFYANGSTGDFTAGPVI